MTTESILNLDCSKEENLEIVKKALCKIQPLAKYSNIDGRIPLEKIEKLIDKLCRKYHVHVQYMQPSHLKDEVLWYTVSIKRTDNHVWLGQCYGSSLYELWAKLAIKIYSDIKHLDIPEREEKL
jgi:hypothetical protein